MPLLKPTESIIYTDDFRESSYSFSVEFVTAAKEYAGFLTISTSVGYWLTTSTNQDPKREQILAYNRHADGNWRAKDQITLVMADNSPVSGAVVFRDPLGETAFVTISPDKKSIELDRSNPYTISQESVRFSPTAPGDASYQILTIAQPYSTTCITLSTDAPDYFSFACDNRPTFLPILTLLPSAAGTHIHIRYLPSTIGRHSGTLFIGSDHDQRALVLEGRSSLFVSSHRSVAHFYWHAKRLSVMRQYSWVWILVVTGSLLYTGWVTISRLAPDWYYKADVGKKRLLEYVYSTKLSAANTHKEKSYAIRTKQENLASSSPLEDATALARPKKPKQIVSVPSKKRSVKAVNKQMTDENNPPDDSAEEDTLTAVRNPDLN